MSQKINTHLFGCACCGKRWVGVPVVGMACPWCFSSVVDLGKLPNEAIAPLQQAGIPVWSNNETIYLADPVDG